MQALICGCWAAAVLAPTSRTLGWPGISEVPNLKQWASHCEIINVIAWRFYGAGTRHIVRFTFIGLIWTVFIENKVLSELCSLVACWRLQSLAPKNSAVCQIIWRSWSSVLLGITCQFTHKPTTATLGPAASHRLVETQQCTKDSGGIVCIKFNINNNKLIQSSKWYIDKEMLNRRLWPNILPFLSESPH